MFMFACYLQDSRFPEPTLPLSLFLAPAPLQMALFLDNTEVHFIVVVIVKNICCIFFLFFFFLLKGFL